MGRRKKKSTEPEFDIKKRFNNVKILVESERPKEAIAYIYLTYNDLIKDKFSKPRMAYQTIREYAITCVNKLDQKPENVYPFVAKIEDIIYGGVEPTPKEFEETIGLFSTLYNEITGKSFSFRL